MKRILLLTIFICSISFSQVTSLSSTYKLARWNAGNKLNAGTIGDTAQSNASLNYNFDRIDAIVGRYIKGDGRFSGIGGYGSGNLDINAGTSSATPVRIVLSDSLYGYWNFQTEGSIFAQQNLTVGGYITTDSILLGTGVINANEINMSGNLSVEGSIYGDTVELGGAGVKGSLKIFDNDVIGFSSQLVYGGDGSNHVLTLPAVTGTLATIDGNQNFTDVNEITADSLNSSGKTQVGTYIRIDKSNDSPNGTINQSDIFVYKNGGGEYYFIIKFNDAGTIRYKYMRLDGTSTSWVAGTSLP